ncbi:cation-translocating P-type ATPase [Halobaculum halobium]|uniref:cation-translocating P-type ATPase n=1 Tax=Halobaculum halobium TaxID=3032281 RepID=UPI003621A921
MSVDRALERLDTDTTGLSSSEVERRTGEYGPNTLPKASPPSALRVFARQFRSPLIYVLAAAALVSISVGERTDAGFIVVVLLANALVGGVQEWRAAQSTHALQRLLRTRATVVRDDRTVEVDSEVVVPGDIVVLESGSAVPADVRLIATTGLETDESTLTGESTTVEKEATWTGAPSTPLADRRNLAFAGTTVVRGRARGVVVATGEDTAVGSLAEDVSALGEGRPPLVQRMQRFTRALGAAVVGVSLLAIGFGVVVRGFEISTMVLFGVALAVAAIPEGLPVSMTVALGVATRRMAALGVIVRRLVAVEGLGSCTYIATDKTGTITENRLSVRRVRLPGGQTLSIGEDGETADTRSKRSDELSRLAVAVSLCNEGSLVADGEEVTRRGDPTDTALLAFARRFDVTADSASARYPQVGTIPFESERGYAATYHRVPDEETDGDGETLVFVKGAPERIIDMCEWNDDGATTGTVGTESAARRRALDEATELAADGYRVLAVAEGRVHGRVPDDPSLEPPSGLRLLGFVGMTDPLRSGARAAVESARAAGIQVAMITGDHPETALAIARELGMATSLDEVVTGAELAAMDDGEVAETVRVTSVFARVAPDQKLRIVAAAKTAGHFVAVTGDGVNDAPALQAANIGIAMGKDGTDVARDAAEPVLSDDNFATIVSGIEQGRVAYDNVRKVIYLLVSTNAAEVVLVLLSLAAGLPLALTAVQLLWLNLVTEGMQDVALGFEPKEDDVLERPPRSPSEPIFDRLMIERTAVSTGYIGLVGFATFSWLLASGASAPEARNGLLLLMVLFENAQVGNSRSETRSVFRISPLSNPFLLAAAVGALVVHAAALYVPIAQSVLETAPVSLAHLLMYFALAGGLLVVTELHKHWWQYRH